MLLHPAVTEISSRRDLISQAIQKGHLAPELARYAQPGWAYVLKDRGIPELAYPEIGNQLDQMSSPDEGALAWVGTTDDEDRDGDIVRPMGVLLKNYSRNPIAFFGHQEKPIPIGVCRSPDGRITVYPEENRVVYVIYYDLKDPDADFIFQKCRRKIINATSVAFVPVEAWRRDDVRKARTHGDQQQNPPGWYFNQWDQTEISNVGIPSNPKAVGLEKDLQGACRDVWDKEQKEMSPKLRKAWKPYVAQAKGCWGGWCPLPGDEKDIGGGVVLKAVEKTGQADQLSQKARQLTDSFKGDWDWIDEISSELASAVMASNNTSRRGVTGQEIRDLHYSAARAFEKVRDKCRSAGKSSATSEAQQVVNAHEKAGDEFGKARAAVFKSTDLDLDRARKFGQQVSLGESTHGEFRRWVSAQAGTDMDFQEELEDAYAEGKTAKSYRTKADCSCTDCQEGKACLCGKGEAPMEEKAPAEKGFVYSVVMVVPPEAAKYTSHKQGEWEVNFADTEGQARSIADSYNSHRGEVAERYGIKYRVERVNEEGPGRKPLMHKALPSEDINPDKACQILQDGEVDGQPLTDDQRGLFGAACARAKKSWGGLRETCKALTKDLDAHGNKLSVGDTVSYTNRTGTTFAGKIVKLTGGRVEFKVDSGSEAGQIISQVPMNLEKKALVQADIDSPGVPGRNQNPEGKAGQEKVSQKSQMLIVSATEFDLAEPSSSSKGRKVAIADGATLAPLGSSDGPPNRNGEITFQGRMYQAKPRDGNSGWRVLVPKSVKKKEALAQSDGRIGGYTVPPGGIQSDQKQEPLVEPIAEGWSACGTCHGDGNCGACGGTGTFGGDGECPECGGSGECGACAGEGHVEKSVKRKEQQRVTSRDKPSGSGWKLESTNPNVWVREVPVKKQLEEITPEEQVTKPTTPQVLAALYSHAKAEAAYLDGLDDELKGTLSDYRRQQLDERMASLKAMFRTTERDDDDLEKMAKDFEDEHDGKGFESTGPDSQVEPGESGLVEQGQVPPEEVEGPSEEKEETKAAKFRQGQRVVAVSEGQRLSGVIESVEGSEGDFFYKVKLDKPYRGDAVVTAEEWQVQLKGAKAMKNRKATVPAEGSYVEDDPDAAAELDAGAVPFNKAAPGSDEWEDEEMTEPEHKQEADVITTDSGAGPGTDVDEGPAVYNKEDEEAEEKAGGICMCGAEVPEGAAECPGCGAPVEKVEPDAVVEAEIPMVEEDEVAEDPIPEVMDPAEAGVGAGVPDQPADPSTEEILERYRQPKSLKWATRKHRVSKRLLPFLKYRVAANGQKYLVRGKGVDAGSLKPGDKVLHPNTTMSAPVTVVSVNADGTVKISTEMGQKTNVPATELEPWRKGIKQEPIIDDSDLKSMTTKLASAIDDLKSLVKAPNMPAYCKAALKHVADQIWYVGKALTDKGKEQKDGGKGSELTDKGKEQRDGGKGSELKDKGEQQGKSPAKSNGKQRVSPAVQQKFEETLAKLKRFGVLSGGM